MTTLDQSGIDYPPKKLNTQITDESTSALRRYQQLIVGSTSLGYTIRYELVTGLFGNTPGALGLWLRQRFYKSLFARVGRGVVFGGRVTLRQPLKMAFGDAVVISEGCFLDARGDSQAGIRIGDEVILSQNSMLICKDGQITIGKAVGIGANSAIYAIAGNKIEIGDHVLIGPYAYLGGTSYHFERTDVPVALQGHDPRGGIQVAENVWIGTRCTILDGVKIGRGAIIAAGAVVNADVPPNAIVAGVPARVIRYRQQGRDPVG